MFWTKNKKDNTKLSYKEHFQDLEFYVLKGDDELYVPMKTINSLVYPTVIVEVEYTTLANEKMIFRSETTVENGKEVKISQSIYVVKDGGETKNSSNYSFKYRMERYKISGRVVTAFGRKCAGCFGINVIYLYCEKWRKTQLINSFINYMLSKRFVMTAHKIRNQQMVMIE